MSCAWLAKLGRALTVSFLIAGVLRHGVTFEYLQRIWRNVIDQPHRPRKIFANGYTDNTPIGPELQRQGVTSNQELSQKRADAVMQFLITQGVNPSLVSARGYGEADTVASNNTASGRAEDRRVVLSLAE